MKKFLFVLSIFFSTFLLSHKVLADTDSFDIKYSPSQGIPSGSSYSQAKTFYEDNADIIIDVVENWLSLYQDISSSQPYYYISSYIQSDNRIQLDFNTSSILPYISNYDSTYNIPHEYFSRCFIDTTNNTISGNSCNSLSSSSGSSTFYSFTSNYGVYLANRIFFSNFDLRIGGLPSSVRYLDFETYGASSINRSWLQEANSSIPSLYDYLELSFLSEYDDDQYTEVNLNNFAYIVLSLKDYSNLISPVEFFVKGQFCLTPVYDYGRQEKNVSDRCSLVYDDFTPTRIWISQTDLDNHVVFYLIAYDTSISNIVKINTRVFDISYITQDNASEPTASINGRIYPILPYNDLSSSATINEDNDIIPGESVNVFDVSSDSNFITELFSNPLQALGNVWTSIISMFALVGTFIGLLPMTLQVFLYTGFSLGIVLGVIKILI